MDEGFIRIKGAREHNLKNIDIDLPRNQMIVVTGVSGSGKSSLAFDTVYAEGYRKYIDSLSTRARLMMEQVHRPDVDYIEGLSPVIAIGQRQKGPGNPRSTVATVTEIADYARLLWAVCGTQFCPKDGAPVIRRSLDDCVERVFQEPEGSRLVILAPHMKGKIAVLTQELTYLRQQGWQRVRVGGELKEIDDRDLLPKTKAEVQLDIVIDRIVLATDQRGRIADSLELALREGHDHAIVLAQKDRDAPFVEIELSRNLSCSKCGAVYEPITSRSFSDNLPDGACPACGGLGKAMTFDEDLVVPDHEKSVKRGAVKAWRVGPRMLIIWHNWLLKHLAEQYPFDPEMPWKDLPEDVRKTVLYGSGDRCFHLKPRKKKGTVEPTPFPGVIPDLERLQRETVSDGLRARLMAYQVTSTCPVCGGKKLRPEVLAVRLNGMDYASFMALDLAAALEFTRKLPESVGLIKNVKEAWSGLERRLAFLVDMGLEYLSLNREYSTLSGGEARRVRLATQLGMGLVNVLYVLDEPTIGLHPHDTKLLIQRLRDLREAGNTVLVVEHDPEVIAAADQLVEIGPNAGASGGRLIFQGTPKEAAKDKHSLAGPYLTGKKQVCRNTDLKKPDNRWLTVKGATEHNLRNIDASFPVGLFTVVTGVSGSGKSTLVNGILAQAAARKLNGAKSVPGFHKGITGLDNFETLVRVDQSPIGQSPRSNPATFTKTFDILRELYSETPLAKIRGYGPGRFSFNIRGGRCEQCQGDGVIRLDMQFLGDVYVDCPSCHGRRYNRETLEVRYKGLNIADALDLTVDEAVTHFHAMPKLANKLETMQAVGLGYVRLGQSADTLSGGEAQRIKLSLELSRRHAGNALYILDEPTTGLHWSDIQLLTDLLFKLRDAGNTIIVIEHNVDVIRLADWIVDLGPSGGRNGGNLMYSGPLDGLFKCKDSLTAKALSV
jgi:excinuclease ABC subunit A